MRFLGSKPLIYCSVRTARAIISSTKPYEVVKPMKVSLIRSVPSSIKRPDYLAAKSSAQASTKIVIKNEWQIQGIREACRVARMVLEKTATAVSAGVTTDELDRVAHESSIAYGAYPSPLGYKGYPKSICTSVNNVACHGIPDSRPLKNGDIVNIDVTVFYNGFHGDVSETYPVGTVDEKGHSLIVAARRCRDEAIRICGPDKPFSAIGEVCEAVAQRHGFSIIPCFCGHGIGSNFHEPPDIIHIPNNDSTLMRPGMVFTVEPILCEGSPEVQILQDGWTSTTVDQGRSAQFEHTILITPTGHTILTIGYSDLQDDETMSRDSLKIVDTP